MKNKKGKSEEKKKKKKLKKWNGKKLGGVGPVDNRPSTDNLHHFVRKKKICLELSHHSA